LCVSRAAQKLNLSSSPHRRRRSGDENIGSDELPIFPNGYAALLLKSPPPAPPALLRRIGVKELTGVGKVSSLSISQPRAAGDELSPSLASENARPTNFRRPFPSRWNLRASLETFCKIARWQVLRNRFHSVRTGSWRCEIDGNSIRDSRGKLCLAKAALSISQTRFSSGHEI